MSSPCTAPPGPSGTRARLSLIHIFEQGYRQLRGYELFFLPLAYAYDAVLHEGSGYVRLRCVFQHRQIRRPPYVGAGAYYHLSLIHI